MHFLDFLRSNVKTFVSTQLPPWRAPIPPELETALQPLLKLNQTGTFNLYHSNHSWKRNETPRTSTSCRSSTYQETHFDSSTLRVSGTEYPPPSYRSTDQILTPCFPSPFPNIIKRGMLKSQFRRRHIHHFLCHHQHHDQFFRRPILRAHPSAPYTPTTPSTLSGRTSSPSSLSWSICS